MLTNQYLASVDTSSMFDIKSSSNNSLAYKLFLLFGHPLFVRFVTQYTEHSFLKFCRQSLYILSLYISKCQDRYTSTLQQNTKHTVNVSSCDVDSFIISVFQSFSAPSPGQRNVRTVSTSGKEIVKKRLSVSTDICAPPRGTTPQSKMTSTV